MLWPLKDRGRDVVLAVARTRSVGDGTPFSAYPEHVTVTVHLPDELAARLAAEATRRGVDVDDVAAELLAAGLDRPLNEDALEAFIGSGQSGRGDLARRHREILAADVAGKSAADA